MTCIVGLEYNNAVYIGGDSAASGPNLMTIMNATEKVFSIANNQIIIGASSSIRLMQAIHYGFKHEFKWTTDINDMQYLVVNFIDDLRKYLEDKNILTDDGHLPDDSELLIGFNKKLWRMDSYFQIFHTQIGFDSIGCGEETALGAMEILYPTALTPEEKILKTLDAVTKHVLGVQPPFHVIKLSQSTVKTII